MKNFKTILLMVALSVGSSVYSMPSFPTKFYFNSFKGGLQLNDSSHQELIAERNIEGSYERYLLLIKYKLDYNKDQEKNRSKYTSFAANCNGKDSLDVTCQ